MPSKIQLKVQKRTITGKKVEKLRKQGLLPANVYGSDIKSIAVTINAIDFRRVYKEAGETGIIDLSIEGEEKTRPTMIHGLQIHPVNRNILHVDLRQVNLKEKIKASIKIELIGESPAQNLGAVIVTVKDEVEVEALPTDLPEKFELDITKLTQVGDAIFVKDIKIDEDKVKVLADPEEIVVKAEEPKQEAEEPVPVVGDEETTIEGGGIQEEAKTKESGDVQKSAEEKAEN